jgi:AcrR family transcriptional regulator
MPDMLSTNPMAQPSKVSFPNRRAAAARNRDKILATARIAFADPEGEISMAEIARRAGVGMATLYRNFSSRRELLEAVFIDEIDAVCDAALTVEADTPGAAFVAWLRVVLAFVPNKRAIVSQLLEHADYTDHNDPLLQTHRARALDAGVPLLTAAQDADEIRADLTFQQIIDMINAIAKIPAGPDYLEPMFQTLLDGLRPPDTRTTIPDDTAPGSSPSGES